jgi:hypothetical protein
MMDETGLEMRQINNWFINHRKRNWNSRAPNSSSGDDELSQIEFINPPNDPLTMWINSVPSLKLGGLN